MKKRSMIARIIPVMIAAVISLSACSGNQPGGNTPGGDLSGNGKINGTVMKTEEIRQALAEPKPGTKFTMGHWDQDGNVRNGAEPISWTVIAQDVGKCLVLSDYVLDRKPFMESEEKYPACVWPDSSIRAWLRETFFKNAFTSEEQELILPVDIVTEYVEDYQYKSVNSKETVFLLSADEEEHYVGRDGTFGYGIPSETVKAQNIYMSEVSNVPGVEKAVSWWLRDPGYSLLKASVVHGYEDYPDTYGWDLDSAIGVRPAMWIVYDADRMTAYQEGKAEPLPDPDLDAQLASAKQGDTITMGMRDLDRFASNGYEHLKWLVLEVQDDALLLVAERPFASLTFSEKAAETEDVCWANSELRAYLNTEAPDTLFTAQERSKLLPTKVSTPGATGSWERSGGPDTEDYLFIPSLEEYEQYLQNDGVTGYWLRSPEFVYPHMRYVGDGSLQLKEAYKPSGVRAMMRVKRG